MLTLSLAHRAILEWFALWDPSIHHLDWSRRRTWPPGYREAADPTDRSGRQRASETGALPPVVEAPRVIPDLLALRLLEGAHRAPCRLTRRGRAALKLQGLNCPDYFESHCKDIFDNHDLRPSRADVPPGGGRSDDTPATCCSG